MAGCKIGFLMSFAAFLIFFVVLTAINASAQDGFSLETTISAADSSFEGGQGNISADSNGENAVEEEKKRIIDYTITNIMPAEFKTGDAQLNIQVKNNGNVEMTDVIALVTGEGFSTYNIIPIDSLKPGEKDYIIVIGNFKKGGNITLNIRIGDRVFKRSVMVIDTATLENQKKEEEMKKAEDEKNRILFELSKEANELDSKYKELEENLTIKKNSNYDVSGISLADLKSYIRKAQSSIIVGDIQQANASLTLAKEEFEYQKSRIDNCKPIKKNLQDYLRGNLLLASTIAGALITLITLFELLRKKKEQLQKALAEARQKNLQMRKEAEMKEKKLKELEAKQKKQGKRKKQKAS
ncbi:MAG: hypothetical protein N3D84_03160 [Candidatus Woesearchaeota archaeon]|nr:hypothetical protein [Candidatus Woesearchaeota archaeon]